MKLDLWPKHHNYTQNRAYPSATQNSPLSPYSGALELKLSPSAFYKFLFLALMVLYQLESLNWDYYNLTYSQNKNKGFEKSFDSNSFETSSFPLYKNSSTTIQTPYTMKSYPLQPQNELQPLKTLLYHIWGFIKPKHK